MKPRHWFFVPAGSCIEMVFAEAAIVWVVT